MNKEETSRYIMLFFGLACFILLLLTSLSLVPTSHWLGQDKIITYINSYLNESQKVSRQDLILLFELEALISPLQHTSTGASSIVDVQVGIGDILSSLHKLISDTADMYIFAISTIEVIKYIIMISEVITPWLFAAVLFVGGVFGLCHSLSDSYGLHIALCNQVTKIVVVLFFVLHIFLPYSLYATALFSKHTIESEKTENRVILHNLHTHMSATHIKGSYKERAETSIHLFEKIVLNLPHKVEAMIIHHTKYMAMSVFEFIILPILLFLIAIGILRWVLKSWVHQK